MTIVLQHVDVFDMRMHSTCHNRLTRLTSFQIWERKPHMKVKHDVGVDVGQHQVMSGTGGNMFWVKRFNPNKYRGRAKCVTRRKPQHGRSYIKPIPVRIRSIPVRIRRRINSANDLVLDIIKKVWDEYPHHSRLSLHAGNIPKICSTANSASIKGVNDCDKE